MTDFATPDSYAKHLASYITDPSTIRAHVKTEWGSAPSVDIIRKMQEEVRKTKRVEGYSLCDSRYRPLFKCGHPETEDNIVIGLNGVDKCKACEDRKWRLEKQRQERLESRKRVTLAREMAAKEAKRIQVQPVLDLIIHTPPSERPRLGSEVVESVAAMFKLKYKDLVSPNRDQILIEARCAAALIMRERGLSYVQIGRFLKRDHTTITHLLRKSAEHCARNPKILKVVGALR